jgi:hypothetical protein
MCVNSRQQSSHEARPWLNRLTPESRQELRALVQDAEALLRSGSASSGANLQGAPRTTADGGRLS